MKTLLRILCLLVLTTTAAQAQTKVFKAVADDMSQDFEPIIQDGNLVGYLVFTQLERASADSFNYSIEIMDENLNDIGTVKFREEKLNLKAVSFDQDVLCLAYVKTNFVGREFKNEKEFRNFKTEGKAALFTQFLGLNGKILASNSTKMQITPDFAYAANSNRRVIGNGKLKHGILLRNISGTGFACFYGDDSKNNLIVFNTTGKLVWQKQIKETGDDFTMLTSGPEVSLLVKMSDQMKEGGYQVLSYNAVDSTAYPKFLLKDKKGNSLKVLAFENDPVSGKPYLAGLVIDPIRGNHYGYGRAISHGPYCGLFTINLNGHTKKDIQASFSYWNDGSQNFIDKYGYLPQAHEYANIERAFRDYQGNTIFAACGITSKVRWGAITGAVLTVWTIYGAPAFLAGGTSKYATRDILLMKQDAAGKLDLATTVPAPRSSYSFATFPVSSYDPNNYYTVKNSDTRTQYLVIDKAKDIDIYNVNQKKVARTIPHKEGNNLVTVFPAKEGYVMVYEFNKKEKTTRLSIEAL
ncbi:MAG TPA: DUF6770 family protein [Puia sp.]|nr:DUF6770 family protein [Puia sp.]